MKKFNFLSLMIILIFFFAVPNNSFANYEGNGKDKGKKPVLQKTTVNPRQSLLNINNATMWVAEDGFHDWVVESGWNGAFPNGTTVGAIFAEGIVWGGKVSDGSTPVVRVNGNTYGTGCAPITRLYRVRPDYLTGDLASDAASFNQIAVGDVTDADIQSLRDQYAIDWNEWPVNEGAPFKDVNNNGTYEPGEDIPGIPGASQTLFIKYNDNLSESNYGSTPIGMEISETYWAYAASGPLANVIYKKVDMVYVGTPNSASNSVIDSMYIVQWADADVGNSSDDFAGCDTTLNFGYAYSSGSSDATYEGLGFAPPAVGYDFLQGVSQFTGNPSDSAIFNLKWRKGYKYVNSKPMSSYVYFAAGGNWSDPGFNYNGTLEFYNLMRGKLPIPRYPSGSPFPEEVADVTADGIYLLAGDPVNGIGKLDGSAEGPGDRRIMVTNGPITMNLGDTAQVVVALVYGLGRNNLSSISVMKFNDASAQFAYDQLFEVPLMPPPVVSFSELDGKISAYWNQSEDLINNTENTVHGPYDFQAYALYQLPPGSSDITKGTRITTFDKVDNISFLSEKVLDEQTGIVYTRPLIPLNNVDGISRAFIFDKDYINNKNLISGQSYTFAITSIGYKDDPGLPSFILESAPAILNVTPQSTDPGVRLYSSVGDTIKAPPSIGDGTVFAVVVDPTRLTGHKYKVIFDDVSEPGTVYWSLIDSTDNNRVVVANQTNQSGDNTYPVVDGFQIIVIGPPAGMKDWSIPKGERRFTWAGAAWGLEGFEGAIGKAYGNWFGNSTVTDADLKTVKLILAKTDTDGNFDVNDPNVSYGYRYLRAAANPPAQPEFAPFIVNPGSGYAYQDFTQNVPLTAWNMETNPPTQLAVGVFENNVVGGFVDGKYWPGDNSVTDNTVSREFLFVFGTPYSTTSDPNLQLDCLNNELPIMWWIAVNRRGDAEFSPGVSGDDEFEIIANHISTSADEFTFVAPNAKTNNSELAKEDVGKINVFPNPYYGFQYRETSPGNKYVTFNHLPDNAVIRIFDLSGVLVKTINHVSTSGQFDNWNLQNDNNYPVASGIYVVYVDMPDLGTTKILKLAIIQEQQLLKVY